MNKPLKNERMGFEQKIQWLK